MEWWSPSLILFLVFTGAIKSQGITFVPWYIIIIIIYIIKQDIRIYLCCLYPAKWLNRLGWIFCEHSWVAGGCYRLKKFANYLYNETRHLYIYVQIYVYMYIYMYMLSTAGLNELTFFCGHSWGCLTTKKILNFPPSILENDWKSPLDKFLCTPLIIIIQLCLPGESADRKHVDR